jgi:hypothetical protein
MVSRLSFLAHFSHCFGDVVLCKPSSTNEFLIVVISELSDFSMMSSFSVSLTLTFTPSNDAIKLQYKRTRYGIRVKSKDMLPEKAIDVQDEARIDIQDAEILKEPVLSDDTIAESVSRCKWYFIFTQLALNICENRVS